MECKVEVGDSLPDIALPTQEGEKVRLRDFIGQPLVLFFYPKDETVICTKEACSFRDSYSDFNSLNAVIFGISSDHMESHKKFHQDHQLNYSLLSDQNSSARKLLGATNFFGLIPSRSTFVIDSKGRIAARFDSFLKSHAHAEWAKARVKELVKK